MGQFQSKVKCIYRLAQSGKTQLVKDIIEDSKMCVDSFGEDDSVHFFISSNNQVLAGQTNTRFNDSFCWISLNKTDDYKILYELAEGDISMIVMCSNKIRMEKLVLLINQLEKSKNFKKRINIWIDEADSTINLWSKYENICSKDIVEQITLVSATFEPVFNKYKRLHVIGYKDPHPKQYRCLRDSVKIENNYVGSIVDYIEHLFEKYPHLLKEGVRAFIPGNSRITSHDEIAELLVKKYNFAILILNGTRKEIIMPGKKTINLFEYISFKENGEVPEEFKEILSRIYKQHKLYEFPFAITGHLCVNRGITFQTNDFLFDYGIIPNVHKKTEAYQLIARLFGNIGEYQNYKPCKIYSSYSNFNKIEKQEAIAMNISKMVYEQNLSDVGKEELKIAQNLNEDSKWKLIQEEFSNKNDANAFLKKNGRPRNLKESKTSDGFLRSSLTKKLNVLFYDDVIKEIKSFSKTSTFDTKGSVIGKKYSRMIICYKDLEDENSVVFIVRIIEKIK
jgi:hypothetical protein